MKILHVVPGLNEVGNGIAVAAKLIADGQRKEDHEVDVVDVKNFNSSAYAEIWVHSCWWGPTIRACKKVLKTGVPLVRMTHANLDPLRMRSKGWKKWPVWYLIERRLMNRAARVVVTCEAEREWNRKAGVKCPIEVMDLKRFFNLKVEVKGGGGERTGRPLHVLYLGRRHPLKGVQYLERAVQEINDEVGVRSEEWRKVDLRIESNIFGEEKEGAWEWADVLCLPTLSENFGLVVAEALERGKRVIVTDGAPAWQPPTLSAEVEKRGGGGEWWDRLVYLRGYRDGTDAERVQLLKEALMSFK